MRINCKGCKFSKRESKQKISIHFTVSQTCTCFNCFGPGYRAVYGTGNGIGLVGRNASVVGISAAMELALRDSLPVEIDAKKTTKLTGGGIGLVETCVS